MKKLLLTLSCIILLGCRLASAQCHADFYPLLLTVNPPQIEVTDSSSGTSGPVTYAWSWGDGTPDGTLFSMTHIYSVVDTYTVCLTITDSTGCTDSLCHPFYVGPPTQSINTYLIPDSSSMYHCSLPDTVFFSYYAYMQGFSPTDSVTLEINYGDGVYNTFTYQLSGGNNASGNVGHIYQNAGNYNIQMIVTGPNNIADTVSPSPIIVSGSCGNISGTVYNDLNGNCTYDAGEELANIPVEIFNGSAFVGWTQSSSTGGYAFNLPTGNTYDIHVVANNSYTTHYAPSCPASGSLTVSTIPSTGNDFGIACPPGFDLQGSMNGWWFRPGDTARVCVNAYNQSCNTPAGQIQVVFPSILTPLTDSSSTYTISGNTVTYTINSPDLWWMFCIPVAVSTSAQLGDSVCIDMNITPVTGDNDPSNNSITQCFPIRNSWDPNDKSVTPHGEGPQGYVRPNTPLTYTIQFQNTGNADALNIYVLDSLDANLDETSFELIGSSHPVQWSLLAGRILRFNYSNINLPDIHSNEPASHGYVMYRINQKSNVAQLTEIKNTAGIYFDYNSPIITNTTLNTVDQFLSVNGIKSTSSLMNIYPNPAQGKCHLYFKDNQSKVISISDAMGKEVFKNTVSSDSYILNTEKFAEGIYTIRIYDSSSHVDAHKLIITR